MEFIQIEVSPREALGSANANRLRRDGYVPAVLYGLGRRNLSLTIPQAELDRFMKTGSHLVELRLGDKTRPAILREVQVDATTDTILHCDFNRVDHDAEVDDEVPVQFKGRAKGESEGGVFQALKNSVAVRARPKDLPREYLLDINDMALGDTITVADLEAREGVTLTEPVDTLIAQVTTPTIEALPEDAEPAEAAEGAEGAEGAAEGEGEAGEESSDEA